MSSGYMSTPQMSWSGAAATARASDNRLIRGDHRHKADGNVAIQNLVVCSRAFCVIPRHLPRSTSASHRPTHDDQCPAHPDQPMLPSPRDLLQPPALLIRSRHAGTGSAIPSPGARFRHDKSSLGAGRYGVLSADPANIRGQRTSKAGRGGLGGDVRSSLTSRRP